MYAWAQEVLSQVPDAEHREYVDDLSAFRERNVTDEGLAAVQAMAVVTERLAEDVGLRPNTTKSRTFSSDSDTRAALDGATGFPVGREFVDLGVDQAACARPSNARRRKRAAEHEVRCLRISLLPLPLARRANFTRAAATSAGCYAPEVNPIPKAPRQHATLRVSFCLA